MALILAVATLGIAPTAEASHTADVEPNGTCSAGSSLSTGGSHHLGTVSDIDTIDFYRVSAAANRAISAAMNPGYQTTHNIDLYLYSPSGTLVDSSTVNSNTAIESVSHSPTTSGTYCIEVRLVSGSGTAIYDIEAHVGLLAPITCSASGVVVAPGFDIGCNLSVSCSGSCTVNVQVTGSSTAGVVSAAWDGVQCQGVLDCQAAAQTSITSSFSDQCRSRGTTALPGVTVGAIVAVYCEVQVV